MNGQMMKLATIVAVASLLGSVILFAQGKLPKKGGGVAAFTIESVEVTDNGNGTATVDVQVTNTSSTNGGDCSTNFADCIDADIKVSARANLCESDALTGGAITVSSFAELDPIPTDPKGLVNCTGEAFGSIEKNVDGGQMAVYTINLTLPGGHFFFRIDALAEVKGNSTPWTRAIRTAEIANP